MGLFSVQSPHCDQQLRSWNSKYLYQNAFIACCGADCQPHIHLFACSAWLLMPPPPKALIWILSPPCLLPSHLHSCRTLILLNWTWVTWDVTTKSHHFYINSFLILHFYMHNFTETSMWYGFRQWLHVSLISLCHCHCWHCTLPTVTLNHYTMLLRTIANSSYLSRHCNALLP